MATQPSITATIVPASAVADAATLGAELKRLQSLPPVTSPMSYVWVAFGMSILGVTAIVFVVYMRLPIAETAVIIAAIAGFLLPANTAIQGLMHKDTHVLVNSRMSALLNATEKASHAEGKVEGKAEEKIEEALAQQKIADSK